MILRVYQEATEANMNHPGVPVIHQIQHNFITYLRLFAGLPGIRFGDEAVTWFVNDNSGSPANMVLGTQLDDGTADQELDRLLQRIGQPTEPVHWLRFPACRPADLGQRLEARGWVSDPGATWMTASLAAFAGAPPAPDGFSVKQVTDDAMLEEWKQLSSAGFEMDIQIYYDAYVRHGFGPVARSLHFIGYQGTQSVTSATLLLSDGIAGIYDISTPPAFRRRGYGEAITAYIMQEAVSHGYRMAWLMASDEGKSVYRSLGFVEEDLGIREYLWNSAPNRR